MKRLAIGLCLFAIAIAASPAEAAQQTCRIEVYNYLREAQTRLQKNDARGALHKLEQLRSRLRMNEHELSLTEQAEGQTYAQIGQYARAAKSFEQALNRNALPESTLTGLRYDLGQLYLAAKQPQKAVRHLEVWLSKTASPPASAYYMVAVAYYQAKNPQRSLRMIQAALRRKRHAPDSWLSLALALHLDAKNYSSAINLQSELLKRHPNTPESWHRLASLYALTKADDKALAVLQLADAQGMLKTEAQVLDLVRRSLAANLPVEAAARLKLAFKRKEVRESLEHMQLLSQAYQAAPDRRRAEAELKRLAKRSSSGRYDIELGQLALGSGELKAARAHFQRGLEKGKLRQTSSAQYLLGISCAELGDHRCAKKALHKAASRDPKLRRQARRWLTYLSQS